MRSIVDIKNRKRFTFILLAATAMSFVTMPSYAGFQWNQSDEANDKAAAEAAAPAADEIPATPKTSTKAKAAVAVPMEPVAKETLQFEPAPVIEETSQAPQAPAAVEMNEDSGSFLPLPGSAKAAAAQAQQEMRMIPAAPAAAPAETKMKVRVLAAPASPQATARTQAAFDTQTAPPPPPMTIPATPQISQDAIQWNPSMSAPAATPVAAPKVEEQPAQEAVSSEPSTGTGDSVLEALQKVQHKATDMFFPSTRSEDTPSLPNPKAVETAPAAAQPAAAQPAATATATTGIDPALTANLPADTVDGFGENMPLAMALQQIAPPPYTFAFAPGVNPGESVSWEGNGKPWYEVVSGILEPMAMQGHIRGNVVYITGGKAPADKQSDASPSIEQDQKLAAVEENLHRDTVKDPGEMPKAQPLSTLLNMGKATNDQQAAPEKDVMVISNGLQGSKIAQASMPPEPLLSDEMSAPAKEENKNEAVNNASLQQTQIDETPAPDLDRQIVLAPVKEQSFSDLQNPEEKSTSEKNSDIKIAEQNNPEDLPSLLPAEVEATPPSEPLAKVVSVAATASVDPEKSSVWEARQGESLKSTLAAWSKREGVNLVWSATHDYTVEADIIVSDSFRNAVKAVVFQGVKTDDKPVIEMRKAENGKNATLVIQDKT